MVNLCVPVLNRYDLLTRLLQSVEQSLVQPNLISIIDNGRDSHTLERCICDTGPMGPLVVHTPNQNLGVAASWNWFLRNVPEDRLIVNDDITFAPQSIGDLARTEGDFVTGLMDENSFSCFILRESAVRKVGLFDERISPDYGYFEDCDYGERMNRAKVSIVGVECGVKHLKSQTQRAMSVAERKEHKRRVELAQANFIKKWGRMPTGVARQVVL